MTDKKFTDEEIIAHLKCCAETGDCKGCGYSKHCDGEEILLNVIDLINRQKAEIERLKERKTQSTMDKRICTNETIDNLLKEMVGEEE